MAAARTEEAESIAEEASRADVPRLWESTPADRVRYARCATPSSGATLSSPSSNPSGSV